MYQYQHNAAAYKLLLTTNANILVPNTNGKRKNWAPSTFIAQKRMHREENYH